MVTQLSEQGCGLVLAGGRSSRMGSAKAWLPFGNATLLERVVSRLQEVFTESVVVKAPGQELPAIDAQVLIVEDELPGLGPLGGLFTGLKVVTQPYAFVTSCDVPFLNTDLVKLLISRADGYDVVVPSWRGQWQPLHAVYSVELIPLIEKHLTARRLRPVELYDYDKVKVCVVAEEEVRQMDAEGLSFWNLNTREDYERAIQLARSRGLL